MACILNLIRRVLSFDRTVYDEIKEGKSSIEWALLAVYLTAILLSFFFLAHRLVPVDNDLPLCPGAGNKMITDGHFQILGIHVSHLFVLSTERKPYQYIMDCRPTDSSSAELLSDMFPMVLYLSIFSVLFLAIYAILLHLIARYLMGGRSKFDAYLFALCLTITPFALLGSLLLVGKDIGYAGLTAAFLWSMICTVQATKEIKGLSYPKATLTVLIASLLFFNSSGGGYSGGGDLILIDQSDGDMNQIGVLISDSKAKEATCYALLDGEKRTGNYFTVNRTRDDFERIYDGVTKDLYGTVSVRADIRKEHWVRICCKTDLVRGNEYQCSDMRIEPKTG